MGAVRQSHPRFHRDGDAPRIALTSDDAEILERVFRHRFIRADDLFRLFPDRSPDRLSRRLMLLYRNRYLDRPIAQIDRFRGGGSQPLVYGLDNAGARYLAEIAGRPPASTDWKARNRSYTRENLDHTLAVTRFMVDLELACRARGDVELITEAEILADAPSGQAKWPVPVRWRGGSGVVQVAPDAIFGLRCRTREGHQLRSFAFVEIDRGTMTIAPAKRVQDSEAFLYRATILRKLLTYAESHRQQLHQAYLGIPIARVLMVTTSIARAEAMRDTAERFVVKPSGLPAGLFLFAGPPGSPPFEADWSDTTGNQTRLAEFVTA